MTTCKEFVLDDARAITAIPVSDYNLGTLTWQLTPTIGAEQFADIPVSAITIGMRPYIEDGVLIPIMRGTGKAKDDEGDATAGRLHTVGASCQIDVRDPSVRDSLLVLERTPCHLLLTYRDNTNAFVAASKDSYLCTVENDGEKTSVQFRIQNYMGAQIII